MNGWEVSAGVSTVGPPGLASIGIHGDHALEIGANDLSDAWVAQKFPITPGTHTLSFKHASIGGPTRLFVTVTAGGVPVGGGVFSQEAYTSLSSLPIGAQLQQEHSISFDVPAGASEIMIMFLDVTDNKGIGASPLIDEIRLDGSLGQQQAFVTLMDGLKAYWKLDEASGVRYDSTANGFDLTELNAISSTPGMLNNAASFSASQPDDGLFTTGANAVASLALTNDWTISCWVNASTSNPYGADNIFSKAGEIYLWRNGDNTLTAYLMSGAPNYSVLANHTFSYVLAPNAWHHLVLRRTGDTLGLFVDGVLEEITTVTGIINDGGWDFWIGMQQGGWPWNGAIDEFGYWGRSLNQSEITTLHGSGTPPDFVVEAPFITTQPQTQSVNLGGTVTFSVLADGSAPLVYEWSKDGVVLVNDTRISGADTATLTILNLAESDQGNYSVKVENAAGNVVSDNAALIVIVAPIIVTQPVSQQAVNEGASATFTVTVSGTSPTFQWHRNGVNITGATGSSYTRTDVQWFSTGVYTVLVQNSAGSVISSDAALSLTAFSIFREDFEIGNVSGWTVAPSATSLTITTDRNHTTAGTYSGLLTSSANKMYRNLGTEAQGPSRVSFWIYDNNGTQNRAFGEVRAYTGAGYASGSLQQIAAAGRYGTAFDPGTGTLAGQSVNTAKYQGRVYGGANTGWFNLDAPGAPNRSVGWHKFEIERDAANSLNFYVDGILSKAVTGANVVTWDSLAIGSAGMGSTVGNAWFDDVAFESLSTPTVITHPSSQSVATGSTVTFSVAATGNVQSYQWRRNGVNISGATAATLVRSNVQAGDAGDYSVVVVNKVGPTISSAATLTVY